MTKNQTRIGRLLSDLVTNSFSAQGTDMFSDEMEALCEERDRIVDDLVDAASMPSRGKWSIQDFSIKRIGAYTYISLIVKD